MVPGAVACVRALAASMPVALVSGSSREEIEIILHGLGILGCFQFFLGAEDYPKSKPAPDGYQKAFRQLGVQGGESVIFEDSAAGIESAHAAGAFVVAVTGAAMPGQDLSKAHRAVPDLTGIDAEWVRKLV